MIGGSGVGSLSRATGDERLQRVQPTKNDSHSSKQGQKGKKRRSGSSAEEAEDRYEQIAESIPKAGEAESGNKSVSVETPVERPIEAPETATEENALDSEVMGTGPSVESEKTKDSNERETGSDAGHIDLTA